MAILESYKTFDDFWIFYSKEHSHPLNKRLHFIGTLIIHLIFFYVFATAEFQVLIYVPIIAFIFSSIGHIFVEKNKYVMFKYPIWSFRADCKMFYLTLSKNL